MAAQVPALQTRRSALTTSTPHLHGRSRQGWCSCTESRSCAASVQQRPFGSLQSYAVLPQRTRRCSRRSRKGWLVRVAPLLLQRQRGSARRWRRGWLQSALQRIRLQGVRAMVISVGSSGVRVDVALLPCQAFLNSWSRQLNAPHRTHTQARELPAHSCFPAEAIPAGRGCCSAAQHIAQPRPAEQAGVVQLSVPCSTLLPDAKGLPNCMQRCFPAKADPANAVPVGRSLVVQISILQKLHNQGNQVCFSLDAARMQQTVYRRAAAARHPGYACRHGHRHTTASPAVGPPQRCIDSLPALPPRCVPKNGWTAGSSCLRGLAQQLTGAAGWHWRSHLGTYAALSSTEGSASSHESASFHGCVVLLG